MQDNVTKPQLPESMEELGKRIQKEDPSFNPEEVSDGRHPCIKIFSVTEYPEIEPLPGNPSRYKVLDTYANLEWLLVEKFGAIIRYNKMNWCREIQIPGLFVYRDDAENSALALVDYLATMNQFPAKKLDQHLNYIAQKNAYHPIVECVKNNPWDGAPRVEEFVRTLESDQPYAPDVVRTWMVAAMAAAHSEKGFINQGMLVLQGVQEKGKTTWIKALDPIDCEAVKEGVFLDPSQKDSIIQMASYWITELGELETIFKKSDIGRLKSYITMQFDHVRFPHAKKPTRLPRRSAYIATVNDFNFLVDETGNRRWWTIRLNHIKLHTFDMKQVWSEIYHLWKQGHPEKLTRELQDWINLSNEAHEKVDPFSELLSLRYDWASLTRRTVTSTQILIELGFSKPSRGECTRMGSIIKKFTGKEGKRSNGRTSHEVPLLLNSAT